jgi:broad specificity phosphatase PhoE
MRRGAPDRRRGPRPWITLVGLLLAVAGGGPARAAAEAAPEPKPGNRYLYLVRHGHYDRDETVDDAVDNGLNALGQEQARRIGERLAGLPWRPERFVSSHYTRARETAAGIGRSLGRDAEIDTLLHECLPNAERADFMTESTGAEVAACEANLAAAWQKYVRPSPDGDRHDLLVCHGNVIRWFVARSLDVDTRKWSRMPIGNGSLTVIAVAPDGGTRLVMFSDVGHLPLAQQSWGKPGARWAGVEEK